MEVSGIIVALQSNSSRVLHSFYFSTLRKIKFCVRRKNIDVTTKSYKNFHEIKEYVLDIIIHFSMTLNFIIKFYCVFQSCKERTMSFEVIQLQIKVH